MVRMVKYLLEKHEDLSLDIWHSHKKQGMAVYIHHARAWEAETVALWSSLAS